MVTIPPMLFSAVAKLVQAAAVFQSSSSPCRIHTGEGGDIREPLADITVGVQGHMHGESGTTEIHCLADFVETGRDPHAAAEIHDADTPGVDLWQGA